MTSRQRLTLAIGATMMTLGAFIAVRLALAPPLTRSVALDVAFALFFLVRGALNIRSARVR